MVTDNRKEKISAFLDNEIHNDEIVSFSLSTEQEDAEIIKRYQMVGEVLRGQVSDASFINVSQAVHDALQSEAPLADTVNARPASAGHDTGQASARRFTLSSWFRPAAGLAVAASVAMVMISTLSDQQGSDPATIANNIEVQPQSVPQMAPQMSPSVQLAVENGKINNNTTDIDPRLVKQHLEFATQDTYQGRLPYVRAVSYQKKHH
jgi:negative regulator of sigma E activity